LLSRDNHEGDFAMAALTPDVPSVERFDIDEPFFTASELAERLRLSKGKIHLAERSGELRSKRFGRSVRFPRSAVQEWIERNDEGASR
jgi:excisionase family DNA binding protein